MKLFFEKNKKGFTLVETLVAISILSLSILASFTAIQTGLKSSSEAKDQTVIFYLAQEVMEYIKNIRDQNVLASLSGTPVNWLSGLANTGDPCAGGAMCQIDSPAKTVTACTGGTISGCAFMKYNTTTGLLGYTGTDQPLKRGIQIQTVTADEVRVTVTLSWTTKGVAKTFQVTESLFDRQ